MDERIVLAPHEMQSAAVEPGDEQRPLLGEGAIDVGGRDAPGASPNGEPKATRILALDGEHALRDGHRITRRLSREQLRTEAGGKQGLGAFPGHLPR